MFPYNNEELSWKCAEARKASPSRFWMQKPGPAPSDLIPTACPRLYQVSAAHSPPSGKFVRVTKRDAECLRKARPAAKETTRKRMAAPAAKEATHKRKATPAANAT